MPINRTHSSLFRLLRMSVGSENTADAVSLSAEEWQAVIREASRHNVLGATYPAFAKLSESFDIPSVTYLSWEKVATMTKLFNKKHLEATSEVYRLFSDNGFRCCILKGVVSASYYPQPELRQNGDIDIWASGDRNTLFTFLKERFPLRKTTYVHTETKMSNGFMVEVHYTPSWMFSPFANRRLQKWFRACAEEQFGNYDEALGFAVPTDRFNGTYMLLHMFRHLFYEGIGLRHVMDYYFVLTSLNEAEREDVRRNVRNLGLGRFSSALMWVMAEVFGLDSKYFLFKPDKRLGRMLLDAIMISGNFGTDDPLFDNNGSRQEGLLAHNLRKLWRSMKFFYISPSEFIWMPFYMTWQYLWRRRKGYLYKGR